MLDNLTKLAKLKSSNKQYADREARDAFYQSQTWRNKRQEILERDNHECQVCKSLGGVGLERLIVHHIRVLEYFPSLAMDSQNLVTVCHDCHNIIHEWTKKRFDDEWY